MLPPLNTEELSADALRWTFTVPPDYPFFEGHFPGEPILPGVVALAWMLHGAARLLGRPLGAVDLANVKFQHVILPGAQLVLTVGRKPGQWLQASIRSPAGVHASALIPAQDG